MIGIESLVAEHAGWIRMAARRYYAGACDADDLASETMYKCLSQGGKFDSARSFKPWALAIMANTFKTQYARRRRVLFTGLDGCAPAAGREMADQRAAIGRILAVVRECARKSRCIECVLLYAKGYSYDEIADIAGINPGTVKSRISAGRRMLREALGE